MKFLVLSLMWVALLIVPHHELKSAPLSSAAELQGRVLDAQTQEGIGYVYAHLDELNRSATSDRDGNFRFQNIPEGSYTLFLHRLGYRMARVRVEITAETQNKVQIFTIERQTFRSDDLIVTAADGMGAGLIEHASVKIKGNDLRREMGITLSQTLQNMTGFAERSLGPAPGRPIIRGLSGERVLILQDGIGTGDVSTTAADHSVTIEPLSAREIQIARGPAALVFGGNAVGGIVNVVNNTIPTSIPTSAGGSFGLHGQTVNEQLGGSFQYQHPFENAVLTLDLNARAGQDFSTPSGDITNTYIRTTSNAVGYSMLRPWGYAGLSASLFLSGYGIPPDPQGGHPNGVDIEMIRFQLAGRGERLLNHRHFYLMEAGFALTPYFHREIESNGSIGTEFAQNTASAFARFRQRGFWIFDSGLAGISADFTDYQVAGSRTPNSRRAGGALFAIQEFNAGRLHAEIGNRFEFSHAFPEERRISQVIGEIRPRSHAGLASSVTAVYNLTGDFYLGSTLLHSYRSPSLEELYSEGPHLAAFTFEIGNPELDSERGFSKELFLRNRGRTLDLELAVYRNYFWSYIFPQNTGRENIRFPDLFDWQFEQTEALFYGFELGANLRLSRFLSTGGNLSYTVGRRLADSDLDLETRNLPLIPPLSGTVYAEVRTGSLTLRPQLRFAADQNRPGAFESETDGWYAADLSLSWMRQTGSRLHTFSLNGQNLFNQEYFNHTSVVKEIFPEPGRNISLLYRMYF
ncbi:iron complex outermembrane recepter protein [Cyclonatronum proteinivorum]|uniref:Iron complex outermembrane recepter protein n=1 Tax=Cyclonatronum proteinivorum TaxID=1457365 RepID=A0A345UJ66_9BACT|nr:TonB-dependent receptor [Cyclonatronum proteinivorum]AXJ00518.1 iron complex outermembrane recepter protein [Cyclonatronum proteinivorum]